MRGYSNRADSSVAHRWANQIPKGKGRLKVDDFSFDRGNVYYRDQVIYSYGKHFPMGVLVGNIAYLNDSYYSNTTSGHQSEVRMAVNTMTHKIVYLDNQGMKELAYDSRLGNKTVDELHEVARQELIRYRREQWLGALELFKKPRSPKGCKHERYISCIARLNSLREVRNSNSSTIIGNSVREQQLKTWRDEREAKLHEATKKRRYQDELKWKHRALCDLRSSVKEGKGVPALRWKDPSAQGYYSYDPVTFHVKGNRVYTSNSNDVHVRVAKALLKQWHDCLGKKSFTDKEQKVNGHYQGVVIRKNGTAKIGCTRFLPDAIIELEKMLKEV